MRKSLAVIWVVVMVMISVQQKSVAEASSYSRLEQLITQGKVPQYVKTTGKIIYTPPVKSDLDSESKADITPIPSVQGQPTLNRQPAMTTSQKLHY